MLSKIDWHELTWVTEGEFIILDLVLKWDTIDFQCWSMLGVLVRWIVAIINWEKFKQWDLVNFKSSLVLLFKNNWGCNTCKSTMKFEMKFIALSTSSDKMKL